MILDYSVRNHRDLVGDSEIRRPIMEIAMRISESEGTLGVMTFSSVLIEPEVPTAFDPVCRRTSGSGH
jgi:hypothetical protein